MNIYDFQVKDAHGNEKSLSEYKGKLVLIVNTASKCGLTPQYKELQTLYDQWHPQGLEILAFPCDQFGQQEPGSNDEIQQFCQLNYGVSFPVFAKIDVNGDGSHPLYNYLRSNSRGLVNSNIKWNFTKFLVDRDGQLLKRFAPTTQPEKLTPIIAKLLGSEVPASAEAQIPAEEVE
jgi:glutathione peroxidase